jgi:endonuclease G
MKLFFRFFVFVIFISCDNSSEDCCVNPLRDVVIIDKGIYKVSYNEIHQQPNWIEYDVSNRPKNVDRGNRDFYLEPGVITSDNADYYKNPWDKGHLAPAATFSDSETNLNKTFSFINCAMQIDDLNRGEWAELEQNIRDRSATLGTIKIRIELVFEPGHEVRDTGVHIPTGFWKKLTYPDGEKECYYFPNQPTTKNWDGYLSGCQ